MAAAAALLACAGPASAAVTLVFNVTVDYEQFCTPAFCGPSATFAPFSTQMSWTWNPTFSDVTTGGLSGGRDVGASGPALTTPVSPLLLALSGLSTADLTGQISVGDFFADPGSFQTTASYASLGYGGQVDESTRDGPHVHTLQKGYFARIYFPSDALVTPDGPVDVAGVADLLTQMGPLAFGEAMAYLDQTSEDGGFTFVGEPTRLQVIHYGVATFDHMVTSAAPEPGAWALMIAGFGLAGATLRTRRRFTIAA